MRQNKYQQQLRKTLSRIQIDNASEDGFWIIFSLHLNNIKLSWQEIEKHKKAATNIEPISLLYRGASVQINGNQTGVIQWKYGNSNQNY